MEQSMYALKGNIIYSESKNKIRYINNGYIVVQDGLCKGSFENLPRKYEGIKINDYGDKIIIPGLVDLHMHAPQYVNTGLGLDLELLDWLNQFTFKEEAKFKNIEYAKKAYQKFVQDLKRSTTTRAVIFASVHVEATKLLMQMLEEAYISAFVGKVNMDRNSPDILVEESAKKSVEDTEKWIRDTINKYDNVKPILTPRFVPSCSDKLMEQLRELQSKYKLPLQSHLSENKSEIEWVKNLHPECESYGMVYDKYGMFGQNTATIMAHCIYLTEEEKQLMRDRNIYIAHCPSSNINLSSGIAPIRELLELGIHIGLGSDISAGHMVSIFEVMSKAIEVSKLYWRYIDDTKKHISVEEAFYLGTRGGGEFFGKVGAFEDGYEFDAVVLDDKRLEVTYELTLYERLQKLIFLSDEREVFDKYVCGIKIL